MATPVYNNAGAVANATSGTTVTLSSFSANAGSNRFLEVWVASGDGSPQACTGVTWGGQSLTQRGTTQTGTYWRFSKWFLKEADFPGGATGNIVATYAGAQGEKAICAIVHEDVDQTNPYRNGSPVQEDDGTTATPSISVTSNADDVVTGGVFSGKTSPDATAISTTAGTQRCDTGPISGGYEIAAASTVAGASTATITWSVSRSGGAGEAHMMNADSLQGAASGPASHALEGAATAGATASGALSVVSEVMYDTATEHVRTGTTSPQTFSHAAASSGVRGVVVAIVHGTSATDHVSAVSYGGVALTRVVRRTDTVTEPGAAELWFVGSGLSGVQGTQTVSYTPGATTDDIHAVCMTLLSDDDLEVIDFDSTDVNAADPSLTLQYGGRTGLAFAALYGGGSAPSVFTPNGNCQTVHDHDLGAFYSEVIRQTTPNNADFAIGGTAATDDVAFVALAVARIQGSQALAGAATGSGTASAAITVVPPPEPSFRAISRRNRPGRGPYSIGRLFRVSPSNRFLSAGGLLQSLSGDAVTLSLADGALSHTVTLTGAAIVSTAADGTVSVTKALAGIAAAGATADGALSVTVNLAGGAVTGSAASAALNLDVQLSGSALAAALASGAIDTSSLLAGAATAGGTASGSLAVSKLLAGLADAGATASANLSLSVPLSGAAIASAQASAPITVGLTLSGAAIGGATASGQLNVAVVLAGAAVAGATAQGSIDIQGNVDLGGDALAAASASGALNVAVVLQGAAVAGASASAGLDTGEINGGFYLPPHSLIGSAVGQAAADAGLTVAKPIAGDAETGAQAAAELALAKLIAGVASGGAVAAGDLSVSVNLAGAAIAGAAAGGQILLGIALDGDALAGAAASGALTLTGQADLSGSATALATASGTLSLAVRLSGAAIGSGNASATVNLSIPVAGSAIATTLAGGELTVLSLSLDGDALAGALAEGSLTVVGVDGELVPQYHGGGKQLDRAAEDAELLARVRDYWDEREARQRDRKRIVDLIKLIDMIDDAA